MRPPREKHCSSCGTAFICGPLTAGGKCWCEGLPHVPPVAGAGHDCLCPECLRREIARLHPDKLDAATKQN